ncbi:MAG TPA: glycosyltransferase, partial [Fimbriimonadaceae bacterium]|nr:glycosyltransferase [Fimbriimonadaceae bacterium]
MPATLDSILAQEVPQGTDWELLVVDNNSTDDTPELLNAYAARHSRVRCLREIRQGVSYARNLCLEQAAHDLIAFTDDDIQPAPDWLQNILRTAAASPDLAFFGGKVLPAPTTRFPSWLDAAHYSPLALLDRGDTPTELSMKTGLLVGANMVLNRAHIRDIAPFDPKLGRVTNRIGSIEDDDLMRRILESGHKGAYIPSIVVYTEIQPERLRRSYHWRWNRGHGFFTAVRRLPEMERSNRYIAGIPGHILRSLILAILGLPIHLFNASN